MPERQQPDRDPNLTPRAKVAPRTEDDADLDPVESDEEQDLGAETERKLDEALTRLPPG